MKTLNFFLVLGFLAITLQGCLREDDPYSLDKYWISIATVENPETKTSFFLRLDDSTLLWTAASQFINYAPADGQRVIANYTILSDKRQTGMYDYDVRINDVYEVLTKPIFHITPDTQDSIGNDPIKVEDIWIGRHYLNIGFLYFGHIKTHFINLVSDAARTYTDGKVHLEFRHNANDDMPLYQRWGYVSFDISELKTLQPDSVQLVIHVNEPNRSEIKQYEITYKYNNPPANVSPLRIQPKSLNKDFN